MVFENEICMFCDCLIRRLSRLMCGDQPGVFREEFSCFINRGKSMKITTMLTREYQPDLDIPRSL